MGDLPNHGQIVGNEQVGEAAALAQFKQQGLSQVGGPNPCDGQGMTKTQYDCAMGAPTSSAWQRCIK